MGVLVYLRQFVKIDEETKFREVKELILDYIVRNFYKRNLNLVCFRLIFSQKVLGY